MSPTVPLLFRQELARLLRGRTMKLVAAMMIYGMVAVAFLVQRPPEEMVGFVRTWFGDAQIDTKLLLFIWTDSAMNKLAVIFGTILAGGILVDERASGSWDLFGSKPITLPDYVTAKLAAAAAAFGLAYLGAVVVAAIVFTASLDGFALGPFLLLSIVHLFAALFAVGFAGLMALCFESKRTGMLVSVVVLFMLVGMAFLGFYWPALAGVASLNPFFHGVALVGAIDDVTLGEVLLPLGVLVTYDAALLLAGRWRARRLAEVA